MDPIDGSSGGDTYTVHCANEPCNCEVMAPMTSEAYCGDSCRNSADREETYECVCGHPPCDTA